MSGYELIDRVERAAVLDVVDPSGGVFFEPGSNILRNGRFRVWEFKQQFSNKKNANQSLAVSSNIFRL